jgi:hypothetical protein
MFLSSRSSTTPTFRRAGTMRASELSRKLRNEVRRSPRVAARFADLLHGSAANLAILERVPALRVTLNPIRAWLHESPEPSRSESDNAGQPSGPSQALDRPTSPGADVVLFTVGDEVRTFAATMPERALLHQLAEIGPATLDAWLAHDSKLGRLGATRSELLELVRAATAAGLTAVN